MTPKDAVAPMLCVLEAADGFTTCCQTLAGTERLARTLALPVRASYWWFTGKDDNGFGGYILKERRIIDKNISMPA